MVRPLEHKVGGQKSKSYQGMKLAEKGWKGRQEYMEHEIRQNIKRKANRETRNRKRDLAEEVWDN